MSQEFDLANINGIIDDNPENDQTPPGSFTEMLAPLIDELNDAIEPYGVNEEQVLEKAGQVKRSILNYWKRFSHFNQAHSGSLGPDFGEEQQAIVYYISNEHETTFCHIGAVSNEKAERSAYLKISTNSHPHFRIPNHPNKGSMFYFDIEIHGNKFKIKQTNTSFRDGTPSYHRVNTLEFKDV